MSAKNLRQSTNTVNSNIINSANVNLFEHFVKPTSELVLRYKLSDYDRGNSLLSNMLSESYTQFEYHFENGMRSNLVILVKTEEGKVFGLYTPSCNHTFRRNDKRKPYIFSIDENITIGNKPDSTNDSIYSDFGPLCNGLNIHIEGYLWKLFSDGHDYGEIETTIENVHRQHDIAYNVFSSNTHQNGNTIRFRIYYQEIEVYQTTEKYETRYIKPEILNFENMNIFESLVLPFNKLKSIQSFKDGNYYLDNKVNMNQLSNFVIMIKTMTGKVFGVYKLDGYAYFYSVDLNEKCPLTIVRTSIDDNRIMFKSKELYFALVFDVDSDNNGYIRFDDVGLFIEFEPTQLIGDIECDVFNYLDVYDEDQNAYEFRWIEVSVYEIKA